MIELARKEYDRLVRLPLGGTERHYNQRYMAFLRDFIAEAEGRDGESVQTEYEERGMMDAMNQRIELGLERVDESIERGARLTKHRFSL